MLGTINLHTHTVISDGAAPMLEMAHKAKELGHCALVVTDHNYHHDHNYQTGYRERDVIEEHELSPIPILLGAEIGTPFGDLFLFGKEVLRNWETFKTKLWHLEKEFDCTLWLEVFEKYVLSKASLIGSPFRMRRYKTTPLPYAMILCHPRESEGYFESFPETFWDLCHGFEIQNGREEFETFAEDTLKFLRSKMPGCMELRNSDAHNVDSLGTCWNETPHEIKNEDQLCKWLRSGRKNWKLNNGGSS